MWNVLRGVFRVMLRSPVVGNILKSSDSLLFGAMCGAFACENFDESYSLSLYGLMRKRRDTEFSRSMLVEFLQCAIKSAMKVNKQSYYETLRDLVLARYETWFLEGRDASEWILKLSQWGYNFSDTKGITKLAEVSGEVDDSWGEADFMLGWYKLPSEDSVGHFKEAIKKDVAYRERINSDKKCLTYPLIVEAVNQDVEN